MTTLTASDVETFNDRGYLIFPGHLNADRVAELKRGCDSAMEGDFGSRKPAWAIPELQSLIWHPDTMAVLEPILGPDFYFHHMHAVRQDAGAPGVNWHQDYEQYPQTNRSHVMVHCFYYLNGLNGEVGDLLVLPGSQTRVARGDALDLFGTQDLPGTVVVDNLPPGSMVVVHSAVYHARRAKPGGEGVPRYFVDSSYCQAGVRWSGYGSNFKPMLDELAESARNAADGRPQLFDSTVFYDAVKAWKRTVAESQGSLVTELRDWQE